MIENSTQVFGPPGCGKTEFLMRLIDDSLAEGMRPEEIAFVSFTRKSIDEARDRAKGRFHLSDTQLRNFRTLHSTGFSALGLRHEDIMSSVDYTTLGRMLGEQFVVNTSVDDGLLITGDTRTGSKYLSIIDRARYRQITLKQEWGDHDTHDMSLFKCVQVRDQLDEYKAKMGKFDYVDMIEKYIEIAEPTPLRLLIVDEAQDLTPLQWEMVKKMATCADDVWIAGDDDQAIHRWTGVDVNQFVKMSPTQVVLEQSYRLPKKVFDVANRIVRRIKDRVPKVYAPTDEEGSVHWHYDLESVDFRHGTWTVMARTNYLADKIGRWLKDNGLYYSVKGVAPITEKQARSITTWRALSNGGAADIQSIRDLYEAVPKQGDKAVVKRGSSKLLDAADPESLLTLDDLVKEFGFIDKRDMLGDDTRDAFDLLGLGGDMRSYLLNIESSGEDITKPPRIKVSTIHAMKGGEDDNCVVYLGSSAACTNTNHPDDEHRIFYVAVTRAKKALHLIEGFEKHRYDI